MFRALLALLALVLLTPALAFRAAVGSQLCHGCRPARTAVMGLRRKQEAQQQQESGLLGRSMGIGDGADSLFPGEMQAPDVSAYTAARKKAAAKPTNAESEGGGGGEGGGEGAAGSTPTRES